MSDYIIETLKCIVASPITSTIHFNVMYIYRGCHKKVGMLDYLGKMTFSEKMFHTKVIGYQVTHRVILVRS